MLKTAAAVAPESVTTTLYRGVAQSPHFNPDDDLDGETVHAAVAERGEVESADALLICNASTPARFPGALTNLHPMA